MAIAFDETNLLAEIVGSSHGISAAERKEAAPRALAALKSFRALYDQGHYGFPDLPNDAATLKAVTRFAESVKGTYDTVCVVGIGGSALGAWALDCGIRGPHPVQGTGTAERPRIVILDNVDPAFTLNALAAMNPKKTMVVVIAKSGATAETIATFLVVRQWLQAAMGKKAAKRIVSVTTMGKGDLFEISQREDYVIFGLPENVGGRFSVLSAVGLVPAALAGINIKKLLKGAGAMTELAWTADLAKNTPLRAAMYHHLSWTAKGKPIQVAFPYSNQLWGMAFWFRQLWAESLGKAKNRAGEVVNVGQTPVAALGTTDQHSQVQLYIEGPNDKCFTFWTAGKFTDPVRVPKEKAGLAAFDYLAGRTLAQLLDAEQRATAAAMAAVERPNSTFALDKVDEEHLGAFMQLLEFETAFVGEMLNINAFDQEGVELGKKFTFGLMSRKGFEDYKANFDSYEAKRASARGKK